MPNDAKLGLVVGVSLVIVVAVIFFRKDVAPGANAVDPPPANSTPPAAPATPPGNGRVVRASPTAGTREPTPTSGSLRRHRVRPGETLYGLAEDYYGDGEQFRRIGEHNGQTAGPNDPLTPGQVLLIPDPQQPAPVSEP